MINYYKPKYKDIHYVKITFMYEDYSGYIVVPYGNFNGSNHDKGLSVLKFFTNFSASFFNNTIIINNECSFDSNNDVYAITLRNRFGDLRHFKSLSLTELTNLITCIEIVACK